MAIQNGDAQNNASSGQETFDSAVSKGANHIYEEASKKAKEELKKKAKKKLAEKGIEKLSADTIRQMIMSAIRAFFTYIGSNVAIVLVIMLCVFSIFTFIRLIILNDADAVQVEGTDEEVTVNFTGGEKDTVENDIIELVKESFNKVKKSDDTHDKIASYIEDKCGYELNAGGLFDFFQDDVEENENGYDIQTDRYNIKVTFKPSIDEIAKNVAAYVTAVDSTLVYYADEDEINTGAVSETTKIDENGNVYIEGGEDYDTNKPTIELDKNGNPKFTKDAYDTIDFDFKKYTANNEDFREHLKGDVSDWFQVEEKEYWEDLGNVNLYKAKIPHTESHTACVLSYSGGEKEAPQENCDKHIGGSSYGYVEKTYTETVWLDGYKGSITIPIYFDVTSYRADELKTKTEKLVGAGRCLYDENDDGEVVYSSTCTEDEAAQAVTSILYQYVDSNSIVYDVNETYYGMLLGGERGYDGVVAYKGELDWPSLAGSYPLNSRVASMVWGKAKDYHDKGKIGGSTTKPVGGCTYFAQLWFYEVYGKNSSGSDLSGSGNGQEFAQVVIDTYPHEFELGREPAPGGLLSVRYISGKYVGLGHIICIDEVEYINEAHTDGWVTFSDGNYDGAGGVRIRKRMRLDKFKKNWNGQYIYANPIRQ